MLAKRVVKEEYLGLEGNNYDHTQWIDGTPLLIAVLMCFMILRFLGLGFNNTSLYLIGGILTVAVGMVRLMIYSLPRPSPTTPDHARPSSSVAKNPLKPL
jgi:hypothetical protein